MFVLRSHPGHHNADTDELEAVRRLVLSDSGKMVVSHHWLREMCDTLDPVDADPYRVLLHRSVRL